MLKEVKVELETQGKSLKRLEQMLSEQGVTEKTAGDSGVAVSNIIGLLPLSSHENLEEVEGQLHSQESRTSFVSITFHTCLNVFRVFIYIVSVHYNRCFYHIKHMHVEGRTLSSNYFRLCEGSKAYFAKKTLKYF